MVGEAKASEIWTDPQARRLLARLAACEGWRRLGFVLVVFSFLAAFSALALILLAFAAAMGWVSGAAIVVKHLLALPAAALVYALLSVLAPTDYAEIAALVQRYLGRQDDLIVTATEAALGRAHGAPSFIRALIRQAERITANVSPRAFLANRFFRVAPLVAGAVATVFGLTLFVPGAWQKLVAEPTAPTAVTAFAQPTSQAPTTPAPALQFFALRIDPPPYTGQPPQTLDAPADVKAPLGSRLTLLVRFSDCETVQVFCGSQKREIRGSEVQDERTLVRPVRWRLAARGPGGQATVGPWTVEPVADRPPRAQIFRPARDLTVQVPRPVSLTVSAADDYGLSRVALQYRVASEKRWREIELEGVGGRQFEATATLDLRPMGLSAGDAVLIRLAATDNNTVTGPATCFSQVRRITIAPAVSRAREKPVVEIQEMAAREEDAFARLQRDLEDLGAQLDRLERQLGGQGQPSATDRGQRQAEMADIAARLKRSAEGVKKALADVERRLKIEQIIDEEVLQKVAELHRLANEVLDKQMKELLDRLAKSLKTADLEKLRADIEQLKRLRERFVEQLNRTLELLRRARLEMMLEALARKLKDLADRQEQVAEKTAGLRDEDPAARRQADRQAGLAREAEPLADEIQRAAEQAAEASQQAAERLSALADRLRRDDPAGDMRQAAAALERLAPSQAVGPQQRALQVLRQAAADMRGIQADAVAQRRRQLQAQATRALTEALALAQAQRRLMHETRDVARESLLQAMRNKRELEQAAARQQALAQGAERLAERLRKLAGQTPVAPPELAARTKAIAEVMKAAGRQLQGGEGMAARVAQSQALAELNQLAADLVDLSAALGQESAQMALSEYLRRLEQLAEQQRALNQQAQQAGSGNPMLSELAAQQAMLKAALEKLMRGAGRELSDKLGGVPQNMDEVAKDLRARRLTRKTKTRQRDILRKMLDAQRSLYTKRRQSRQRVAERPKPYKPAPSPPELKTAGPPRVELPKSADTSAPPVPEEYRGLADAYQRRIGGGR